ncbi:TPA: hypothetical protein SL531_001360 [Pseudomonas aeruginosa]|nr:hypothetical protein [Pseudomonas aeruginosa]
MARIQLKQPGQAVADFAVDGHVITVAGVLVDCRELQQDSMQVVEVRQSGSTAHIGGDGAYLAHIVIPARVYEEIPVEGGEEDEGEEGQSVERVAQELDPNAIEVTLWPLAN